MSDCEIVCTQVFKFLHFASIQLEVTSCAYFSRDVTVF